MNSDFSRPLRSAPARPHPRASAHALTLLAAALALSACATAPVPSGSTGKAASTPAAAATPAPSSGAAPTAPPFDTVIKGATAMPGAIPTWVRQEKVWIELRPQDFNRPFYLSPKLLTGIGEGGLFGGLLASRWGLVGRPQWVEFRKVHQQVQLVALNPYAWAEEGSGPAQAVKAAFSPSLLASAAIGSAPHAERGTVLVEVSSLLAGDLLGLGLQLQRAFRQNYGLDGRNSAIVATRSTPTGLQLDWQQHFVSGTLVTPTPGQAAAPGVQPPVVPSALPDPRSLFLTVQYTLVPLAEKPVEARMADARVGYFTTTRWDFTSDLSRTPRQRFINRWHLVKKDPAAEKSAPERPLVFWLDRSIPTEYRETIRAGVLAWNKAFEAIGITGAIEARDSTADEPRDIVGNGQIIVRWMTNHQPSFGAIGPVHVDPRSGEILTADIALESLSSRNVRAVRSQILSPGAASEPPASDLHGEHCQHGELAAEQLSLGLATLSARGILPPDSAEARQFVQAYLRDTTMHEVGHVLGLRHNFKASRWRTPEQLRDRSLTENEGHSASVMDYAPINLGPIGQAWGAPFQTTLGPYDFWAIEYGYKPLSGDAQARATALRAIAARSGEPAWRDALNYGSDEDNAQGIDPEALTFDLGRDPVAFARQRLALMQQLLARQEGAVLVDTDDAALLRRRVAYALRDIERAGAVLARQIGGVVTRRDAPGTGRDPVSPVPASQQREALSLMTGTLLMPQALDLSPALQRRMVVDFFERDEGVTDAEGKVLRPDFDLTGQWLRLQRLTLDTLMSDTLAERLLENAGRMRDLEARPLTLSEVRRTLSDAVWRTAALPQAQAAWQRNLQREYVNRLSGTVVRGSTRADVRALARADARERLAALKAASAGSDIDRAHRQDLIDTLQRALDASVVRTGP